MSTHRWVICDPETGEPVTKQRRQRELAADLEKDRRRRFVISKANGELTPAERKRQLKKLVKREFAKLSPEQRQGLLDKLSPVSRLSKSDDTRVKREYSGRPVLVSDRTGREKRLGDQGVEKTKDVSMEDVFRQPASYPDGTRRL